MVLASIDNQFWRDMVEKSPPEPVCSAGYTKINFFSEKIEQTVAFAPFPPIPYVKMKVAVPNRFNTERG
jgi:hypothetical protein